VVLEAPVRTEVAATAAIQPRGTLRAIFSFPGLLAALLIVVTVFTVRTRFSDPDMWWHLRAGELIWDSHSIPRVDVFSFTAAGHPWTAQEWLSEVTIYGAYRLGGYSGLMLWLCVLVSALVLAGYALSALYSGNIKVAFLGGLVTWLFSTIGLAVRPHMIGYLLLLCELLFLHLGRKQDARWFYALPPLFALWINFHSSFVIGFVVLTVVLGCSFMEFEWGLVVARRWSWSIRKTLAIAMALSCAALFLNPIGPKLIWYPFEVMFTQPVNLGFITEWQQPDFGTSHGLVLLIVAGLMVAIPLVRCVKIQVDEMLLVALLFYFAARHGRMEFLFGIVAAPILCRLLADAWDRYQPEHDRILPNAVLMLIAAVAVVLAFPNSRNLAEQVNQNNPVNAVEFLQHSGLSGRMLNEYVYGGYLIWAAPQHRVFVDGRADVYEPAGVLADYMRFMSLDLDPKTILEKYRIDFCLLSQDQPIARVLPLIPGWRKVYSDKHSVIFARHS
jgi:hypothetical protein